MRLAIPVAAYHTGNPAEFFQKAFTQLGYEADILSQWNFYTSFKNKAHDFYLCVDSGGPLNLFESSIADCDFTKLAFYMIDYRRGRFLKNPNDADTSKLIGSKGGWIFQAQLPDVALCETEATDRVSWLPLAADEDVWNSDPKEELLYDIGFIGNIWDNTRADILQRLQSLYKVSPNGAWGRDAAKVLRQSKLVFNISSFYDDKSVAYDWNMRCAESLMCGRPLCTNFVPDIPKIFVGSPMPFIKTYSSVEQIVPTISAALEDNDFLNSGILARSWSLSNSTYRLRAQQLLSVLNEKRLI